MSRLLHDSFEGTDSFVNARGIPPTGGVGAAVITAVLTLQVAGIPPAGAVGAPIAAIVLAPAGIAPSGGVGAPSLLISQIITAAGIAPSSTVVGSVVTWRSSRLPGFVTVTVSQGEVEETVLQGFAVTTTVQGRIA